jgi:hypothetical protein
MSAAAAKRHRPGSRQTDAPRNGSRLRVLYDELTRNPGVPVRLHRDLHSSRYTFATAVQQLRTGYGLDIRSYRHGWHTLVGEWTNVGYIDHMAPEGYDAAVPDRSRLHRRAVLELQAAARAANR